MNWPFPELSKDEQDDLQLYGICDYGAAAQRKDPTVLPQFNIMGCEIEKLKAYMAKHHPNIRYRLTYPIGGTPRELANKS